MKHRIAFRVGMIACVGMTALAAATSAQAQMVYAEPPQRVYGGPPPAAEGGLPPSEILMAVRSSGLRPLTQPERRGPRYVLLASDNMGGQLRVMVSAHDGRIVHAEPAHDPRFAYHPVRPRGLIPMAPPQHAAVPPPHPAPELRDPTPPLPRNARTTAAPQPPAPREAGQPAGERSGYDRLRADTSGAHAAAASAARDRRERDRGGTQERLHLHLKQHRGKRRRRPTAAPASGAAAPSAAPATKPPAETQMVPVAPLD